MQGLNLILGSFGFFMTAYLKMAGMGHGAWGMVETINPVRGD